MRLVLIGFAALMALASAAEARDGCGGGIFFNGVRCVPMRAAPPPGFRPPPPRTWAPAGPDRWGQPDISGSAWFLPAALHRAGRRLQTL